MISRLKGGKSFVTLDDDAVPLPPRVVMESAGAIACLSEKGRVLVFGIDEMKILTNGGRGVTLMELEPKETLLAAQPISQKGVNVIGTWAGDKPRTVELFASGLEPHFGKRAKKGKPLSAKLRAKDLAPRILGGDQVAE
jgi:topoisomerase-4 subunit A